MNPIALHLLGLALIAPPAWLCEGLKVCSRCGAAKPLADFYAHKTGYRPSCKRCDLQRSAACHKRRRQALRAARAAQAQKTRRPE